MKLQRYMLPFLAVALLFSLSSLAEGQDDDFEWKTWRTRRSHAGFNGHGGFFVDYQMFESSDLDAFTDAMGLKSLGDGMIGAGGFGMGHVGDGWRIGGGGFGHEAGTSGIYTDTTGTSYNRKLTVSDGGGGLIVEYSPWMIGPVNFGAGALLGGGGIVIKVRQDDGTFTWGDLSSQYIGQPSAGENIVTELTQGFFLAEPYLVVRVHLLDWLALNAMGGWRFSTISDDGWLFGDNVVAGGGPNFNSMKPVLMVGLAFGG